MPAAPFSRRNERLRKQHKILLKQGRNERLHAWALVSKEAMSTRNAYLAKVLPDLLRMVQRPYLANLLMGRLGLAVQCHLRQRIKILFFDECYVLIKYPVGFKANIFCSTLP